MEGKYLLAYTLFGVRYNSGFKSFYRHFDSFERMKEFVKIYRLEDSCIMYKKI